MRNIGFGITIIMILLAGTLVRPIHAQTQNNSRVQRVEMTYVEADNYRNRLVNAKAAFDQLQSFVEKTDWQLGKTYSFLKGVLGGSFDPKFGYVMTEKGYAYGACGASSLLNHLVQTATFRDGNGVEHPVFQTVVVWTWNGDRTYGAYGATIYLDTTGKRKTKDYVWRLNPSYRGISPRITVSFDTTINQASLTMIYSDNPS
jgi:hypothetical protein